MQRMMRVVALAAMTIGIASGAYAQVASSGTIEVFVTDPQGQTLPGATVEASAANTTTKRVAVTDETGKAVLELLEPSEVYTVKITMQGFKEQVRENQLVRVAQVLTIRTVLALPGVEEAVTVSAETTPLVDVRSATTGSDITLRLTESLPTGRSYQSYLQLVPGVLPDDPSAAGNPASRSGLNYNDIGGALGVSTDNLYYLDGINVTDPVTGTFGANMNTEVIAEQKVTTGGIHRAVPRLARPDLAGRDEVRQQPPERLRQLLLPEHRPRRREQARRGGRVLDEGHRVHHRRSGVDEQGVVLRQLPLLQARGRRQRDRHAAADALGREPPEAGLREGHVRADR